MQKIANYIDGSNTPPASGNYLENYNPGEGKVYSLVPDSDATDIEHAVNAAEKAFAG